MVAVITQMSPQLLTNGGEIRLPVAEANEVEFRRSQMIKYARAIDEKVRHSITRLDVHTVIN